MLETVFISGGLGLCLLMVIVLYIFLVVQQKKITRLQAQQHAWKRAQEARMQQWREEQEQHIAHLKQEVEHLATAVATYQAQQFQTPVSTKITRLTQHYETCIAQSRLEVELARLPRVEDIPLPSKQQGIHTEELPSIINLQGADLSQRDLSHRYLAHMNLRNAQLAHANLFMADLSGADLTGANLVGADLTGANLTDTDLYGANLTDAHMLVTDLNNAVLIRADLRGAHHLTREQLASAIVDKSTLLDASMDITLPRRPRVNRAYKDLVQAPETGIPCLFPDTCEIQAQPDETARCAP